MNEWVASNDVFEVQQTNTSNTELKILSRKLLLSPLSSGKIIYSHPNSFTTVLRQERKKYL